MTSAGRGSLRVAASLWSVPRAEQPATALRLAAAGLQRWHWDVADGSLGAPGGFTPDDAARLGALTGLPGEAHLMVADPVAAAHAWLEVCDTVVVHVESTGWEQAVELALSAGATAAVAVAPSTSPDAVAALPAEVGVLVMSVPPGGAGSAFSPATFERLDALRGRHLLGVDGSVTLDLAHDCARHGATWVVSGTDLCGAADPARWLASAADGGLRRRGRAPLRGASPRAPHP